MLWAYRVSALMALLVLMTKPRKPPPKKCAGGCGSDAQTICPTCGARN